MNDKDLEYFEQKLLSERRKLNEELENFSESFASTQRDASGELSAYTYHMADLGTDANEREKSTMFASKDGQLLYHVDEALRLIHKKEFGLCQECGQDIDRERLEVVPFARLCIDCKEQEESGEA